ncbi:hypothetical protein [Streptomyces sp. NPDC059894]|uniref:hypothetical protein n=1 Tax=unclassified Streptomyces TaxID=2593676 RepID=UPI00365C2346
MTARITEAATAERLRDVLAEIRATADQGDALDSALIAAVEGAALIAVAAEDAGREDGGGDALELARQALGAMRACVVATTVSVRTLADRRRARVLAGPVGRPT